MRSIANRVLNVCAARWHAHTHHSTPPSPQTNNTAQEAISDGLRRELAGMGVSVSIVQPAFVDTAIFGKVGPVMSMSCERGREGGRGEVSVSVSVGGCERVGDWVGMPCLRTDCLNCEGSIIRRAVGRCVNACMLALA